MTKVDKQAVFGIIFSEDRTKVLLIKRRDIPVWVLPGGGLDLEEAPEHGVQREMKEETGVDVQIVRKVAEYLPVNRYTQLSHVFECKILSGTPSIGEETLDIAFFPVEKLPKLLPPPYPGWILDAHQNFPTMLRKEVEGVSYWVFCKLLIMHPLLVLRFVLMKLGIHFNQ